jgi:hypothetical protein
MRRARREVIYPSNSVESSEVDPEEEILRVTDLKCFRCWEEFLEKSVDVEM